MGYKYSVAYFIVLLMAVCQLNNRPSVGKVYFIKTDFFFHFRAVCLMLCNVLMQCVDDREYRTGRLSRNVGNYQSVFCNILEE